jgi:hypothetical protein
MKKRLTLLASSLSTMLALPLISCGRNEAPPATAAPPDDIAARVSAVVTPGAMPSINVSTPPAVRAILGSDNKVTAVGLKANGDVQAVHQNVAGGTAFTANTVPAMTATSIPAVAETFDAQLVIMARTVTGAPNIVQRSTGPITGPFSAWTSDSGDSDATTGAGLAALGPTLALNTSGFMEAFIVDVNGRSERKTKTAVSPTSWTTWAEQGSGVIRSEPVPVKRANGAVSLIARTEGNGLAIQSQTSPGSWIGSTWSPFAGAIVVGTPTAVLNSSGTLTLIMLGYGADATSGYAAVAATQNGANWDWAYVGGNSFTSQAAVKDGNGKIRIFTLDGSRQLQQIVQNGTAWGAATVVSTTKLSSAPAAVVNGNGDVEVFARFDDKSLNRILVPKTGSPSGWTAVGSGLTWSLPAEDPPSPLTGVTTQHNDNARTGANLGETILNTSNVNQYQFGKLFSYKVDGLVFAQPLYVPNVTVAGVSRNLLLVATMRNKLYAFDADSTSATTALWTLDLGYIGGQAFPAPVFPNVSFGNNGCACPVIFQSIGITSTPVVDPATNTAYLVAMGVAGALSRPPWSTAETDNFCPQYHTSPVTCIPQPTDNPDTSETFSHKIFSVDLTNGTVKNRTTLSPSYTCPTNPGALPCEPNIAVGQQITFKSKTQLQRAALLLSSGKVYVAFAGLNDRPPFHGWITAVNASDLSIPNPQNTFLPVPVRKIPRGNTNPGFIPFNGGGIWQSGEGPAADAAGNVYVETGNGPFDADVGGIDFGNTLLKLSPTLTRLDWFAPRYNFLSVGGEMPALDDVDLSSAGPLLLPGNRVLATGKMGIFHLADTTTDANGQGRMGRFGTGAGSVDGNVQNLSVARNVEDGDCHATYGYNSRNMPNIHGSPVFWDDPKSGGLVYVMGEQDHARALRYSFSTSKFTTEQASKTANNHGDPAGCACLGGLGSFPTYKCATPESYSADKAPSPGPNINPAPLFMPGGILSLSARSYWGGSGVLWGIRPTWDNATWKIVAGTLIAWDAQDLQKQLWSSDVDPANHLDSHVGLLAKFVPPTIANGRVYMATFKDSVGSQNEVVVYGLYNSVH